MTLIFNLFVLESGVRVTCDVGYLCANFSLLNFFLLLRPRCSRLRPDVRDRQTSDSISLNAPAYWGQGHNKPI